MVDLNDAGRRLASHQTGPIPPVAELHQRAVHRVRRRRRRRTSGAILIGVAVVGAAVGVLNAISSPHPQTVVTGLSPNPSPTHPATRLPAVSRAAGSRPIDWNQLRLWLPPGWTVTAGPGATGTKHCWTPPAESVYLTTDPVARCESQSFRSSVEVTALTGAWRQDTVRETINGLTVWIPRPTSPPAGSPWVVEVPSLGVTITAYGDFNSVVDSLGPSSLHAVLDQRYPVAVPNGWKTLTFHGFRADVPPSWPTHIVKIVRDGESTAESNGPGICGDKIFAKPSTYLGYYTGTMGCFNISFQELLDFSVAPTDGLWLQDSTSAAKVADQPRLNEEVFNHLRSRTAELTASYETGEGANIVDVNVTFGGRTLQTTIGLGVDPTVAEEVISSLRLAR